MSSFYDDLIDEGGVGEAPAMPGNQFRHGPACFDLDGGMAEAGVIGGITVANGTRRAWIQDGHIYIDGEEMANYSPGMPAGSGGLIKSIQRVSNIDYDYIQDGTIYLGTLNSAPPLAQFNNPEASDEDGLLRGVECHSDVDQPYVRDGILMLNGMPVRFDPQWFVVQDRRVTLNLSSLHDAIVLCQTYTPGWDW